MTDFTHTKDKAHNFSMFYGIAVMMYEATLISDQGEFDSLVAEGSLVIGGGPGQPPASQGDGPTQLDPLLLRGARLFLGFPFGPPGNPNHGAGCGACHGAPTFSENQVAAGRPFNPLLTVGDVNNVTDIRDLGFANIGIRPVFTDLFSGDVDPYGNPLS